MQALKRELGAFDTDFFEQLEDLKYRYTRLQELKGDAPPAVNPSTPYTTSTSTRDESSKDMSKDKSQLPLDRLAWSLRNSMTAMDRASWDSPLIKGRTGMGVTAPQPDEGYSSRSNPSAFTYAPGARGVAVREEEGEYGRGGRGGTDHIGETGHIGGAPGPNRHTRDTLSVPSTFTLGSKGSKGSKQGFTGAPYPDEALLGGMHAIGAGTHSVVPNEVGGTYSNLCERRLAFELSSHPAPEQATRSLIHRVIEVSNQGQMNIDGKTTGTGFVTVPQLKDVIASVGLRMTDKEIALLSVGFASDGKGGIDAEELCGMINSMLYNLVGEHAARAAEATALLNGKDKVKKHSALIERLMVEVCEGILTHDRRAVLSSSKV